MKIAGAEGVGAAVSPVEQLAGAVAKSGSDEAAQKIATKRPFGKTVFDYLACV